ncbi:MAG: hypothetical protein QOJ98_3619 [Acidobacteriota bacterium]|jgi:hypothetical protein|nr:hypothetical protein [Acidobacteriota bacterium]
MRRSVFPALVLILMAGCSSAGSTRPAGIAQPDISSDLSGDVFFGSGRSAPVTLDVSIRNNANTAITVRQIEVTAPGMTTYTIRPVRRLVNEQIAAGDTKTIPLFTQAITSVRNPAEPLTLRTIVHFEANGARWREFVQQ